MTAGRLMASAGILRITTLKLAFALTNYPTVKFFGVAMERMKFSMMVITVNALRKFLTAREMTVIWTLLMNRIVVRSPTAPAMLNAQCGLARTKSHPGRPTAIALLTIALSLSVGTEAPLPKTVPALLARTSHAGTAAHVKVTARVTSASTRSAGTDQTETNRPVYALAKIISLAPVAFYATKPAASVPAAIRSAGTAPGPT